MVFKKKLRKSKAKYSGRLTVNEEINGRHNDNASRFRE